MAVGVWGDSMTLFRLYPFCFLGAVWCMLLCTICFSLADVSRLHHLLCIFLLVLHFLFGYHPSLHGYPSQVLS